MNFIEWIALWFGIGLLLAIGAFTGLGIVMVVSDWVQNKWHK